jgi:hypothetical protein
LQTLNEYAGQIMYEPGAIQRPKRSSLNVRFAAAAPLQLQIKHAMKTSAAIQNKPIIPSLFQIAARLEDFAPAIVSKSSPPPQTPFADLMLHPEKLEAALRTARNENDAFDATRQFSRSPAIGATRSATSKNFDTATTRKYHSRQLVDDIPPFRQNLNEPSPKVFQAHIE